MLTVPNCLLPNCPLQGNMADGNVQGNHDHVATLFPRNVLTEQTRTDMSATEG